MQANRHLYRLLLAAFNLFCACNVNAHHGFGVHYDVSQQVIFEGVLQKVELRNPHSFLHVLVESEQGSAVWVCETQAKSVILRKGIKQEQFVVGQTITIQGSAARRQQNHCEVGTVYFEDGSNLIFRSQHGRANLGSYASPSTKSNSVFGTWIRATFNGVPIAEGSLEGITAAGKRANTTYSSVTDDPSIYCRAANPLRAWVAPGTPTQIRLDNDTVIIQHEFMDTQRVIKLHPQAHKQFAVPEDYQPNEMGFGYAELGINELFVYSIGFKPGVLITQRQGSGVLFTDQMRMTEIFRLNSQTGNLDYYWESVDSNYYPDGIRGELQLTRVDMQIEEFNCKLTNAD